MSDEDRSSRLKIGSVEDPVAKPVTITDHHLLDEYSSVTSMTKITEDGDEVDLETFVPPMEQAGSSEKSKVVQQVNALRQYVMSQQIDRKLCDLYNDYVANFPRWSINQDPRIPPSVFNIRSLASSADYEEVAYQYHGKSIHFSLRRDLGPADLALLTMAEDNHVKVSLRVSVEIGALEPDRIEVYHRGVWEALFLQMYAELSGDGLELADNTAVTQATEVDIEVLKQNFGIHRDGEED